MDAPRTLLEITRDNGTFRLDGELDMSNASEFSKTVRTDLAEGQQVIFDCANLRFIDSSGMAALVDISRLLGPAGRLILRAAPSSLVKAVHVLGLDRLPNLELTD